MATKSITAGLLHVNEINSKLRGLRLVQVALIASTLICEGVVETVVCPVGGDWTLWQWVITAFALYGVLVGFFLGRKLMRASRQTLAKDASDPKGLKQWKAANLMRLGVAGGVSNWGILLRIIFGAAFWQVLLFYAVGLLLLLLWTPKMPTQPV
jgi:hypothetical protein